jgi:TorA maturation chaperone TorD
MSTTPLIDDVDHARAREYSLLATLLLRSPDADLLQRLAQLRGDSSRLGKAHTVLGTAAAQVEPERVAREYFNLFVGVGRGELLPYSSYYLTGSLNARPLVRLREALRQLGIERAHGFMEPEDHAGVLFEVMGALAGRDIAAPGGADGEFFESHLAPWIGRFFEDLEQARSADFYAGVGALGRTFMAIEAEAFKIGARD